MANLHSATATRHVIF